MALKPVKPTVPPAPSRANPGVDFSNKADTFVAFQTTFADYMDATAEFVDERADEALAAALAGTLPSLVGQAGRYIRVNPAGTAAEFRTTAQLYTELGFAPTVTEINEGIVPPGAIGGFSLRSAPPGWLKANGAAVSRTAYAALFAAICPIIGTATVTIASPGVFTLNGHGLINGDPVRLTTTGALPTGLNTTTTYFVVAATTNTFQLSATLGGAAINTSGTQSGTHTVRYFPHGAGDGSTTFNLPDYRGEFMRGLDDGRGVDTGRVLGSAQGQAIQSHTHDVAGTASMSGTFAAGVAMLSQGAGYLTAATGGAETRPRNLSSLICIKY